MIYLRHLAALIALACCIPAPALAQTAAPTYLKGSTLTTADAIMVIDKSGNPLGTNTNPLDVAVIGGVTVSGTVAVSGSVNVVCTSGCSSGGGGGAVTQSGTWNVGLTGTLPAFASTPTVQLDSGDSTNLAAVVSSLSSQLTTLNSQLTQLTSAVGYLGTLASYATYPLAAQTSQGVLIGAVQGTAAAGANTTTNILTFQGCSTCTPVPMSGSISQLLGTTNGWTPLRSSALSTTVVSVKSSAGELGMLQCYNPNSAQVYIQIFNVASGSVTLGTTAPTLSIPIAPLSTGGLPLANPGINFSTAISIAATTTATGSTAASTAPDCNEVYN